VVLEFKKRNFRPKKGDYVRSRKVEDNPVCMPKLFFIGQK